VEDIDGRSSVKVSLRWRRRPRSWTPTILVERELLAAVRVRPEHSPEAADCAGGGPRRQGV